MKAGILKYFSDSVPINAHYPPDNNEKLSSKLYYHKLGTDSKAEDVLVQISHKNSFRTPKKPVCLIDDLLLLTDLSYGYKLTEKESEKIGTSIIDQDGKIRLTKYVRIFGQELTAESEFQLQGIISSGLLLVITNHGAPNRRLVLTTLKYAHDPATWKTLIKEDNSRSLIDAIDIQYENLMLLTYCEEWRQKSIYLYNAHKKQLLARINPPNESVTSTTMTATHIYFITTSWLKPNAFYSCPFSDGCKDGLADSVCSIKSSSPPANRSGKLSILKVGDKENLLDWTDDFEVKQSFYPSGSECLDDSTRNNPAKNCKRNGLNPTIIYSYGDMDVCFPLEWMHIKPSF
uniref:Peptidase S9A N-terminal domain-containing protein n=1 Tax=Ditylenchus dipsaci TaxID=166011 RepID=A0A915ECP9_9BILA